MNRETLVKLQMLTNDLHHHGELPVTCSGLAHALDIILDQFSLSEARHELTLECLDDLAAHTGYQLKQETEEVTNG